MTFRRLVVVVGLPIFLLCAVCKLSGTQFFISNGVAIAAYGDKGAYLVTSSKELLVWDDVEKIWKRVMTMTPGIRQMDCLGDGTKLMGTDGGGAAWEWNGLSTSGSSGGVLITVDGCGKICACPGIGSESVTGGGAWDRIREDEEFDWVIFDPITEERRGLVKGLPNVWDVWDNPDCGGCPWNRYLPAGDPNHPTDDTESKRVGTMVLVDNTTEAFTRWQRGDFGYRIALNQSGVGTPFKIFAYTPDCDPLILDRIVNPPTPTPYLDTPADMVKDPDLVLVKQIAYDEVEQNLWCVDENGWPWHWNNQYQGWELRRARTQFDPECSPCECNAKQLLRCHNDFYVRTTYIEGDYAPVLIILKDSMIMHLIVGELSTANMDELRIYIQEEPRRNHKFHNILQLPTERPQKLVRVDGSDRVKGRARENGYLECLLVNHAIIADRDKLGVYPSEHRIIRR